MRAMSSSPDPRRVCLVTGTDTGVGKTTVTVALVRALRRRGRLAAACKPVETGCSGAPGDLRPADALRLHAALDARYALASICPQRFALPAAPAVAAEAENRAVDLAAIATAIGDMRASSELLFLEGAGGLLVPLSATHTIADLAGHYHASVLIVARTSLGTINHCRLTVEAALARGLRVAGIVLTQTTPRSGPEEFATPEWITRTTGIPLLGTLPYLPDADAATADSLADLAEQAFDLEAVWRAL